MSSYLSYKMASLLSARVPRGFAYWVGLRMADRFYSSDQRGREAVMANLRQIMAADGVHASEEKLQLLARHNFQYFGKYLVDFFKFAGLDLKAVSRLVSLEHPEHLEAAKRQQKGVIIVTAHLGNWELGGAVVCAMGHRVHAVFLPETGNKINALFQKHRSRRGMNLIPFGRAARGVLQALKNKETVAMLADRDYSLHQDDLLPFFGRTTRLPSGPARIAQKTGAPIVPAFMLRQPDDTFLLRFHPPITPTHSLSVMDLRCRIRDALQIEIARNPQQWFMFENFWQF